MKTCPACKTQYSDDTLQFCLQDGTPLTWVGVPETPTVVLGETETVVSRGGQGKVTVPIGDSNSPPWQPSQVTRVATAVPEKKRSNTVLAIGLAVIGMLVLFAIIGVGAIVFWRNSQQAGVQNANAVPNANVSGPNIGYNSSPTPHTTASPVRTSTPFPPSSPPPPPTPPPVVRSSYPSTTRLKFGRGAYSTSFSGDINPGDSRSLVLACRAGQTLTANVSSGSGCVQMRGSGSSLRTTTHSGDNYISVTSNCPSVVHFSVSITII
jgi:hypothetical protein